MRRAHLGGGRWWRTRRDQLGFPTLVLVLVLRGGSRPGRDDVSVQGAALRKSFEVFVGLVKSIIHEVVYFEGSVQTSRGLHAGP